MRPDYTGFTLVETLVAIAIVTIAVGGVMFGASRATVAAQIARDQLVASGLAQEGIEYVRRMRDDAYLDAYSGTFGPTNISQIAWANFLTSAEPYAITRCRVSQVPGVCTLDPAAALMGYGNSLNDGTSPTPLYLTNGGYTQNPSGGVVTPFTRTIKTEQVSATEERIISTVTWNEHGSTYTVRLTDHLTPWQ